MWENNKETEAQPNYLVLIKKGVLVKGDTEMKLSIVVILK